MVWRHTYNAASVHVESASALSLPFSLFLFLSLAILFSLLFSLIYFLSPFFFLFIIFLFFSLFFQQGPALVWNEPVAGCSPISPTLGLLCLTTPKAKCVMSVSPSVFRQLEVPSVQLVQFSCPRASHPLVLKMVSDKEYPRVHTNRQHVLAFICLVERFFFERSGLPPGSACLWSQAQPWGFSCCSHDR